MISGEQSDQTTHVNAGSTMVRAAVATGLGLSISLGVHSVEASAATNEPSVTASQDSSETAVQPRHKPLKVLAVGDSLTLGQPGDSWPEFYSNMTGNPTDNLANGGQCIAAENCYYSTPIYKTFKRNLRDNHYDVAVIAGGINDICRVPAGRIIASLRKIANFALSHNVTPVLTTIPPLAKEFTTPEKCTRRKANVIAWVREGRYSFIDWAASLENKNGVMKPKYNAGDGIHVNTLGRQVMARDVKERHLQNLVTYVVEPSK